MSKIKNITAVLLLVTVTVFTIIVPSVIGNLTLNSNIGKKEFFNYTKHSGVEITPFYVANTVNDINISSQKTVQLTGKEKTDRHEQCLKALYSLLETDKMLYQSVSDSIDIKNPEFFDIRVTSALTTYDGNPIALSFVNAAYTTKIGYMIFTYEEKTAAVTEFSYEIVNPDFNESDIIEINRLEAAISIYCENVLNISEEDYFIDSNGNSFIGFQISQQTDETIQY